ncbi:MAG TPA: NAD(P)H-dependent oxidoreductase [Glycomyces sp.]|nr:NAD(P)H-dependent oxidoreductase [Glycomyces sp.]
MNTVISVTTLVGNPRRLSKTLAAAEALAQSIATGLDTLQGSSPIDLAELYRDGIEPPHDGIERAIEQVGTADILIIGTPVYKASYTGLLKLFLDQLPPGALSGTAAVPVTIAGAAPHRLLADLHLRPVLAELGARLPVPSLVLEGSEYGDLPRLVQRWSERHLADLTVALAFSRPTAEVGA